MVRRRDGGPARGFRDARAGPAQHRGPRRVAAAAPRSVAEVTALASQLCRARRSSAMPVDAVSDSEGQLSPAPKPVGQGLLGDNTGGSHLSAGAGALASADGCAVRKALHNGKVSSLTIDSGVATAFTVEVVACGAR